MSARLPPAFLRIEPSPQRKHVDPSGRPRENRRVLNRGLSVPWGSGGSLGVDSGAGGVGAERRQLSLTVPFITSVGTARAIASVAESGNPAPAHLLAASIVVASRSGGD